jgi:hydrogenase maturation protease
MNAGPGSGRRPPILVVGIGNPLLGDDAVGWRIVEAAARRLSGGGPDPSPDSPWGPVGTTIEVRGVGPVELDCLSLGGLSLMERLVGYDRAILVDSLVTGGAPAGAVASHPIEAFTDFSAGHTTSTHDTSLMTALETGRRMGAHLPDAIDVVTVEALQVLDFSEEMTPAVEAAVPRAVDALVALLRGSSRVD